MSQDSVNAASGQLLAPDGLQEIKLTLQEQSTFHKAQMEFLKKLLERVEASVEKKEPKDQSARPVQPDYTSWEILNGRHLRDWQEKRTADVNKLVALRKKFISWFRDKDRGPVNWAHAAIDESSPIVVLQPPSKDTKAIKVPWKVGNGEDTETYVELIEQAWRQYLGQDVEGGYEWDFQEDGRDLHATHSAFTYKANGAPAWKSAEKVCLACESILESR